MHALIAMPEIQRFKVFGGTNHFEKYAEIRGQVLVLVAAEKENGAGVFPWRRSCSQTPA